MLLFVCTYDKLPRLKYFTNDYESIYMNPIITPPGLGEAPDYYERYIGIVKSGDAYAFMQKQLTTIPAYIKSLPEPKSEFRYAPGKWTVKELIFHITDCERVFGYRALTFARGESITLPGFNQDIWTQNIDFSKYTLADLAEEFEIVRKGTLLVYKNLSEEALSRKGIANKNEVSVRAIAYITAGHAEHHLNILRERYISI